MENQKSESEPLSVTVPAVLILGFVLEDGVSTEQECSSLAPAYGVIYLVPSKQNYAIDFPVHTWKALGHAHTHSCGDTLTKTERKR